MSRWSLNTKFESRNERNVYSERTHLQIEIRAICEDRALAAVEICRKHERYSRNREVGVRIYI